MASQAGLCETLWTLLERLGLLARVTVHEAWHWLRRRPSWMRLESRALQAWHRLKNRPLLTLLWDRVRRAGQMILNDCRRFKSHAIWRHLTVRAKAASLATDDDVGIRTTWITFLTTLLLFFVSASTVTHLMLLQESGVRLPALNVEVPLKTFYFLAPLIVLSLHWHIVSTFKRHEDSPAKKGEITDSDAKRPRGFDEKPMPLFYDNGRSPEPEPFEPRATPRHRRSWGIATLVSLTALPPLVLITILGSFAAYQDIGFFLLHMICIIVSIWLSLSYLRPPQERQKTARNAGLVIVLLIGVLFIPYGTILDFKLFNIVRTPFSPLIFPGPPQNTVAARTNSASNNESPSPPWVNFWIFSRVLVLDSAQLPGGVQTDATAARSIVLRRRMLRGAILTATNLRSADLEYADLRHAHMEKVWLEGAYLERAKLDNANLHRANLSGARLPYANLTGTILTNAVMIGADLDRATLPNANFTNADLRLATLSRANVKGADFRGTDLRGALMIATQKSQKTRFGPSEALSAAERTSRWTRLAGIHYVPPADGNPGDTWLDGRHLRQIDILLQELACDRTGYPYARRALVAQIWDHDDTKRRVLPEEQRRAVALSLQDKQKCPHTENDLDPFQIRLKTIAKEPIQGDGPP